MPRGTAGVFQPVAIAMGVFLAAFFFIWALMRCLECITGTTGTDSLVVPTLPIFAVSFFFVGFFAVAEFHLRVAVLG
jgi:hypothetical protein